MYWTPSFVMYCGASVDVAASARENVTFCCGSPENSSAPIFTGSALTQSVAAFAASVSSFAFACALSPTGFDRAREWASFAAACALAASACALASGFRPALFAL